jgi:metallo-beta-lactamase class B
LGGAKLTCHLTPGHTKGCTTWSMDVTHDGKVHHAVFFGSTSILDGVPLVGNAKYPRIAEDLAATYRKLKALPCDVFLAPHAGFFGLAEKAERLKKGATLNPFINPQDYRDFIEKAERAFLQRLEKERKDR